MLMLSGVVVELSNDGPSHMALFTSPRVPGTHFKVQVDADVAAKLRTLITTEHLTAEQTAQMTGNVFGIPDDEEEPRCDPFGRN